MTPAFQSFGEESPRPFLTFYRKCWLDTGGEYQLGSSWEAVKRLTASTDYGMVAELFVQVLGRGGRFSTFDAPSGRLRPYLFSAVVRVRNSEHTTVNIIPGSHTSGCRSLQEVSKKVARLDYQGAVTRCLKRFYLRSRAECVYKSQGDTWVPFCSVFEPWSALDSLPFGKYASLRTETCGPKVFYLEHFYYGQAGRHDSKIPIPSEMVNWIPANDG